MPWRRPDHWLILLLAIATTACAGVTTRDTGVPAMTAGAETPIAFDQDQLRLLARILHAEDRREYDDALFRSLLSDPHPELRRYAIRAAGRIQDPAATPLLIEALEHDHPEIRAEAAFALGQLGDTSATIVDALATRATEGQNPDRAEAVAALGKLRTDAARHAIEAVLAQATHPDTGGVTPPPTTVTAEAILASWRYRRTPEIVAPLIALARSPDLELRWRATYALMRLGDPASIPLLLDLGNDPDPLVRALAVRAIRPALVDSAALRPQALELLARAAVDQHPHVRINALAALAGFRLERNNEILVRALNDPDRNVALRAIESLAQNGGASAVAPLDAVARSHTTPIALRAAALTGLLRLGPAEGMQLARTLAQSNDWLNRLYLARALAAAPPDSAVPLLTDLAYDDDPRVAGAALRSLGGVPVGAAPGLRRLFLEQLGAADVGIRAAALQGLRRRAETTDLPVILDAYERATHDEVLNDAALAAVAVLDTLAKVGVPVQNTFFRRFGRSTDPIVRREVRQRLGEGNWGPVFPVDTKRDLSFYQEIVQNYILPDLSGQPRPRAVIHTATGSITIELAPGEAPLTVHNFVTLAERGYFNGHRWHRVVPNFVLQDGDPRGDGSGGPGYSIRDEINRLRYLRGTVGMALAGADTGGSQFFITHAPQPHLDGGYTIFGQVVSGIDVADQVAQDDPIQRIEIVRSAGTRATSSIR